MFTIKVISRKDAFTRLYEGFDISYCPFSYSGKKNWLQHYKQHDGNMGVEYLFVPPDDDTFHESAEWFAGEFCGKTIELSFREGPGEPRKILIIEDAEIYIMHKGQTVDKIYC